MLRDMESGEEGTGVAQPRTDFWNDARPTNQNPNFVRDYFASSRLHFIGSFRARYESMMVSVGQKLGINPAGLLKSSAEKGVLSTRKRPRERVIVHIDMDCFFASIAIKKDPSLAGKCIAVAHGGGEISSCSYEARKFGVRAGMFCRDARKLCPELLSVPYDFAMYEDISIQIYARFYDYPGVSVEAVSVDEAYLDITLAVGDDQDGSQSGAEALVQNLRSRIFADTGCTASAGVGPSKLMARLATKAAKPNGQLRIRQDGVIAYLDTLKVRDLPGIGWRTNRRLAEKGVETCRELRALPLATLQSDFGDRQGQVFHDLARALDARPVEPLKPRKSIGAEASWGVRFEKEEGDKVMKFITDMADLVATRVLAAGAHGTKVTFKVYKRKPDASMIGYKHLGHGPCSILTRSGRLPSNTSSQTLKASLQDTCWRIHGELGVRNEDLRGVGLQMNDLTFADLNFDFTTASTPGISRKIDSFFATRTNWRKDTGTAPVARLNGEPSPFPIPDAPEVAWNGIGYVSQEVNGNGDNDIVAVEQVNTDVIPPGDSDEDRIEVGRAESPRRRGCSPETGESIEIPEGWDKDVFRALPDELKVELLKERSAGGQGVQAAIDSNFSADQRTRPSERDSQKTKKRLAKRGAVTVLEPAEMKKKRRQGAQITMTQFADISELRIRGNDVLDADEFREKPLKDCLELLEDFKGEGLHGLKTKGKDACSTHEHLRFSSGHYLRSQEGEVEDVQQSAWDIPSPPNLSSDSESSGGFEAALDDYGYDNTDVYEEENLSDYAGKLKAWMRLNAEDVKSAHVELLRGRVLELVRRKRLERVCSEMRTIGRFADELEEDSWRDCYDELVDDVQSETKRMYGFRLALRKLSI